MRVQRHTLGARRDGGDAHACTDGPAPSRSYWHDSQVGSSIAQNLGSGSCRVWASLDERGTAESRAFLPAPTADALPDSATAFEVETTWLVEAASRRQKWIDQAQSLNIYMAGASGKKLDDTYKLAWLRGVKTTYYLRTMGATHAEKSTVKTGQLNAVPEGGTEAEAPTFCAIDNPECEACQ